MKITPELSRAVGWNPREVAWPKDMREIEAASDYQLLEWRRFLPPAGTELQRALIERIFILTSADHPLVLCETRLVETDQVACIYSFGFHDPGVFWQAVQSHPEYSQYIHDTDAGPEAVYTAWWKNVPLPKDQGGGLHIVEAQAGEKGVYPATAVDLLTWGTRPDP